MHEFYTGGLGTVVGSDCPKVAAMYQIVHLLTARPKVSVTLNVGNVMKENQISAEVRFFPSKRTPRPNSLGPSANPQSSISFAKSAGGRASLTARRALSANYNSWSRRTINSKASLHCPPQRLLIRQRKQPLYLEKVRQNKESVTPPLAPSSPS
jgi:hypothetical protein